MFRSIWRLLILLFTFLVESKILSLKYFACAVSGETTGVNTTGTLTANMMTYYDKKLLTRLESVLVAYKFGTKKIVPVHSGKNIVWTIYTNLAAATNALTSGTTPTGTALTSSNVSGTVAGYGAFTYITDFLNTTAIDPVIDSAAPIFGYQAALTVDTLILNALSAGTAQLANAKSAVSDLATSDTLDAAEIRLAVRTLEGVGAMPHSLTPGFFPLLVHPSTKYDLISDTSTGGWLDVRKYTESNQRDIEMNKIGDIYGAKAFMTQNLRTVSSVALTYNNLLLSDESFGVVDVTGLPGGGKPKICIVQPNTPSIYDPLGQQGTIGWKLYFLVRLFAANRVIVIKTGATS